MDEQGIVTFLLVRHGRTLLNQSGRFRGRSPVSLDPLGVWQAAQVAQRLADLCGPGGPYPPPVAVGSSPLLRAVETAQPIGAATGAPLRVLDGLADLDYGAWQGQTPVEAARRDPELYQRWLRDPEHVPAPGGESLGVMQWRALGVLQQCLDESQAGQCWVLVAHDVVWRAVFCWALRIRLGQRDQFGQDPAALNILELALTPEHLPILRTVNDTAHLQGQADWPGPP